MPMNMVTFDRLHCSVVKSSGSLIGEGYEVRLLGEVRAVAHVVFVKAGDNGVAVVGNEAIQPFLLGSQPVALLFHCRFVGAHGVADVEVAVPQRLFVCACVYPVPVHAEGTHHHCLVVPPEVAVNREQPLGLEFEEHGVDDLNHVIASQSRQQTVDLGHQLDAAPLARLPCQVDVARVVFPEVAVRCHRHLVAQLTQAFGECPMYVAVFS